MENRVVQGRLWPPSAVQTLSAIHRVALLVVWLSLIAMWIDTCVRLLMAGSWWYAVFAAGDWLMLTVLYLAEGMELAVTDLLDKDPAQVSDPATRRVLSDIQRRPHFFLANRQVFVVAVIAFMSQTTAYPWIVVPGIGVVTSAGGRFWFSFLLTTFTVLWFAQVTPKQLAIANSELFLEQSRPLWTLIRVVGVLGLPRPADLAVGMIKRMTRYRDQRRLRPSPAVRYSDQVRIDGCALDRMSVAITLDRDGLMRVRRRFLVLVAGGSEWETYGSIEMPGNITRSPRIRVLGLFETDEPEQLRTVASRLDAVFDRCTGVHGDGCMTRATGWRHDVVRSEATTSLDGRRASYWVVRGRRLEGERGDKAEPRTGSAKLLILLYEAEATCRVAERDTEMTWSEQLMLPCRMLTFSVRAAQRSGLKVRPNGVSCASAGARSDSPEEDLRLSSQLVAGRGEVNVQYPVPGTTYRVRWTTAPS